MLHPPYGEEGEMMRVNSEPDTRPANIVLLYDLLVLPNSSSNNTNDRAEGKQNQTLSAFGRAKEKFLNYGLVCLPLSSQTCERRWLTSVDIFPLGFPTCSR